MLAIEQSKSEVDKLLFLSLLTCDSDLTVIFPLWILKLSSVSLVFRSHDFMQLILDWTKKMSLAKMILLSFRSLMQVSCN